jgi:hypothetical protein
VWTGFIHQAQDWDWCWPPVNTVMNIWSSIICGEFLDCPINYLLNDSATWSWLVNSHTLNFRYVVLFRFITHNTFYLKKNMFQSIFSERK